MKKFEYEQYDYAFLYGLLTKKQQESLQGVLNRFIGYPNTEATRREAKYAVEAWVRENNIKIDGELKLNFI